MKRKEAIKIIKQLDQAVIIPQYGLMYELNGDLITHNKILEAFKIAIEALKKVDEWEEYKAECDSYHTK